MRGPDPRTVILDRYNAAIARGDKVAVLAILREYGTYSDARALWRQRPKP